MQEVRSAGERSFTYFLSIVLVFIDFNSLTVMFAYSNFLFSFIHLHVNQFLSMAGIYPYPNPNPLHYATVEYQWYYFHTKQEFFSTCSFTYLS